MNDKYKKLAPFICETESSGRSIRVHVLAPTSLLMKIGGFYKFELSNEILEDAQIYADAWYSFDPAAYEALVRD